MEMIAPMAKILAEANGIDWRSIQGSGEAGTIVEQDILNYLMRVMNGEEEPPSTPVDEPPPDWTGEMPPMPSMEMMTQAGIESDITDFVASSSKPAPLHSVPGTAPASDLDQDALDFELDDELNPGLADSELEGETRDPVVMERALQDADYAGAPAPLEATPLPDMVSNGVSLSAPDLQASSLARDVNPEYTPPADAAPVHPHETPMDIPEGAPDAEVELAEPLRAEVPQHVVSQPQVVQPLITQPEPSQVEVVRPAAALAPEPAAPVAPPEAPAAAAGFGLGGLLSRLYKRGGKPAEEAHTAPAAEAPVLPPIPAPYQAHVEETPVVESVAQQDSLEVPALGEPVEAPAAEAMVEDSPVSAPLVADQLREEQLELPEPEAALASAEPEVAAEAPMPTPPAASTTVLAPVAIPEPALVPAAPAALAAQNLETQRLGTQSLGRRQGLHLRLSVDTRALDEAGSHLGDHLGHAVPAEVLLARAAARQLGLLSLTSVGVAHLGDEATPRAGLSLHGSDFRAAVQEYHANETGDWADLMVVDAGALGLDELHLLGDLATLSLGRRESGQAALTLTGPLNPQSGAAFLQAVADLLQTPIKLLF